MKKFVIPGSKPAAKKAPAKSNRTPDNLRQAKSKAALLESGGRRISVNLSGPAVADLEAIKARDGTDNTGAIRDALRKHAKR